MYNHQPQNRMKILETHYVKHSVHISGLIKEISPKNLLNNLSTFSLWRLRTFWSDGDIDLSGHCCATVSSAWLTATMNRLTQPTHRKTHPPAVERDWNAKCAHLNFSHTLVFAIYSIEMQGKAERRSSPFAFVKTIWCGHYRARFRVVWDFPKVPESLADFTHPWLGWR